MGHVEEVAVTLSDLSLRTAINYGEYVTLLLVEVVDNVSSVVIVEAALHAL